MKNFTIIIPTLNEAGNIGPLLKQISEVTESHMLAPQVIFVDDGSTDGTRDRVEQYSGTLDVSLIKRNDERGLAGAVIAGAEAAVHPLLMVMDADLSHPASAIPELLKPLFSNTHDMVIGSRYIEGGGTPGWPIARKISSLLASIPACLMTSVSDPLAGFFAVRRELLLAVDGKVAGFKIGLEVLVEAGRKCRVLEIPISFTDRQAGMSKMNTSILGQYLCQLGRLQMKSHSIFRGALLLTFTLLTGLLDASMFSLLEKNGYSFQFSHMIGLTVSVHCSYLASFWIHKSRLDIYNVKDYLGLLVVIILSIFLRGGLLANFHVMPSDGSGLIQLLLATTSSLTWLVAVFTLSSGLFRSHQSNSKTFGLLLICYSVLLRLTYLGSTELIQEEAYYWNYAQHMAPGYLDHPPVVALLIKIGTFIFGDSEFGVRIGAFSCWFLTATFVYQLTKRIFNAGIAFRAIVLLSVLPIFFGVALVVTPDAPLITCWAGALFFLYCALIDDHATSWYWVGICFGIGLASKYTIVFLGPAIILFMAMDPMARKWFLKPHPYLAAMLALVIFSPVVWWNYQNEWVSFLFQSQGRLQAGTEFSTHELLASILLLLTPTGVLAVFASMSPQFKDFFKREIGHARMLSRSYWFGVVMAAVPLLIFVIFSLSKEIKLNWTGPLWLAMLPFMASAMVVQITGFQKRIAGMWPKTLVILVISYGAVLHYCALGLPGVPFESNDFLFGWEDFARQVEEEVQQVAEVRGEHPLVVGLGKYRISSGLAFYRNKQHSGSDVPDIEETAGSHLFGHNSLMYRYWYPAGMAINRDLLVVSKNENQLRTELFNNYCEDLDELGSITIEKHGKKAGKFYYRLLKYYTPDKRKSLANRISEKNRFNRPPTEADNG